MNAAPVMLVELTTSVSSSVRPGKTDTLERGVRILVAIANGGSVSEF